MVRETRHLWVGNLPETVREDRIRDHFKRSTEDVSPPNFEQRGTTYYERSSRLVSESEQYIRRPNNYHTGDIRGRARDRLYRNGPYSSIIDRTTPVGSHHRVSTWYDTSPSGTSTVSGQSASSPATRSVYGNVASAVVQPDTSSYDCQLLKKKKSRSGSESPSGGSSSINAASSHSSHLVDRGNGGSAASSRSHSRSPSSCSSTNSSSSNSHASSPVSGSDPPPSSSSSRTRNLQSAVSAPNNNNNINNQSGMTVNNQLSTSSTSSNANTGGSSSSSSSTGQPVVHSEDNRPLAICVRNLPARSSDTSLKDGLFHEYKKHGKVTWVKVVGQNAERYALVGFKKPDDVEKALEVSHDKLFFGCKIEVAPYQGYDVEDNEFRPYEAELDEYHPKSTRTLFIGNLEKDITGSELRKHFECFGEIIEIDIKKQGMNAYAFCQYSDIVSVVKAMRKMDGEHLGNNRIKLGFGKSMPTSCVWIDGIADSVSESHLSGQFLRYGPVSQVVIDRERKLALVSFDQVQYAQTAVKEMRGATLRGRKLQVDFASRECQDAFYEKLEKQSSGNGCNSTELTNNNNSVAGESTASRVVSSVAGARFSRYDNQSNRSRASSFSRHSNVNSSGAASPNSAGNGGTGGGGANISTNSTTAASGATAGSSTPRGGRSRSLRHSDYDYSERRFRSYDEYSQGSGASHDDDSYNYSSSCSREQRSDSPQSRLGPIAGSNVDTLEISSTNSGRRRCDKSPGDIRNLQKERFHLLEQLEECPSSGDELVSPKKRMKFDHSSHHHNHHHTVSGLQSQPPQQQQQQSHTIDCSTSSNNSSSLHQTNLSIGDSNCDVLSNHSTESGSLHHRKCVEVRRLSECSSLKYTTQMPSSRRPSTESGSMIGGSALRHGAHEHNMATTTVYAAPHSISSCKRRRTSNVPGTSIGATGSEASEYHTSRGRGHQLHSHHSHEASGGESADGSRPGTPLCDERPEVLPSEPRRIPRDKPHEPMMLPLPKFGIQFFQQNRTSASGNSTASVSSHAGQMYSISSSTNINISSSSILNSSSSSTLLNSSNSHSSLSNTLSSPPLLAGTRLSSSSFHHSSVQQVSSHHGVAAHSAAPLSLSSSSSSHHQPQAAHHHHHHHHHHGQPQQQQQQHHHAGPQPGSGSTTTGGIEQPPASPIRPRSLSSNSSDSDLGPLSTSPSIEERIKTLDEMFEIWSGGASAGRPLAMNSDLNQHSGSSFSSRHKYLDLDVNDVKPSEIVKSVLAKKSIFDDDLQRLKNISDKYEPGDFSNLSRGSMISSISPGIPNLAATKTPVVGCSSVNKQTVQAPVFPAPGMNQLQRLNSSPMNSPQAMSPYNSPSPSPVVNATAAKLPISQQAVVAPTPAKSLQYPFPSHPPIVSPTVAITTASSVSSTMQTVTPTVSLASQPPPPPQPKASSSTETISSSRPKTSTITKSFSVPEKSNVQVSAPSQPTNMPHRVLSKAASIPGSTNVGTVKSTTATGTSTLPSNHSSTTNSKFDEDSETSSSEQNFRRGSLDSSASRTAYQKPNAANASKKGEKAHKHNHRNDGDRKLSKNEKSRSESIDKRKSSHSEDTSESNENQNKEEDRLEEERKRKEQEEKEAAERERQERLNRERIERERLEKERQRQEKEKQDRERREKEQRRREKEEREREEKERREREEKDRREREDRERRQHELQLERERKEREERERREREERERKEREDRERREHEERERLEKERREREEQERREREEKERREKEESERREREERERREREERDRRDREERERQEREENERKEREERERRELEERARRDREEKEERERSAREQEQHNKVEQRQKELNERLRLEEKEDVVNESNKYNRNDDEHEKVSSKDRREDDHPRQSLHHSTCKEDKHNKENSESIFHNEDMPQKRRERKSSATSPSRLAKRRLSSQDSIENDDAVKRMRISSDNRKILDRRDSKDPNRPSKHHKSHSRGSSLPKNSDEKSINSEDRHRKESGMEEKKNKDREHKKYDRERSEKSTPSSHRYKKHSCTKEEKDYVMNNEKDEDMSSTEKHVFDSHDLRSTDEDGDHQMQEHAQLQHSARHRAKKEHKERKRHEYDEDGHRQHGGRSEQRRHDNNRHSDRKSSRTEEGSKQNNERSRIKAPSRKLTQSSNDSDSDEPKKHSIFDIPDDGPYVSMYDKVKARSCKNMQKQEEEKKIKAKFTQLKQSRAKREEKKRSTSYDGDSDSDFDDRHAKYKSSFKMNRSSGFINSSSDEGTILRQRDSIISDSDSDIRRGQYNRARLNELCDGDSSDSGILQHRNSCKKISSKRNSRSTRIASDSSDIEEPQASGPLSSKRDKSPEVSDSEVKLKAEIKTEIDEEIEEEKKPPEHFSSIKTEKIKAEISEDLPPVKVEVKTEIKDSVTDFFNAQHEDSDNNACSGSAVESKDSLFDQLFSPESRKKHKKSKKRPKSSPLIPDNETSMSEKFEDVNIEKHSPTSLEHVFDELKRQETIMVSAASTMVVTANVQFSEKKKHKERKEKKREKSRDDYDKSSLSKEERHRIKKSKKSSKGDVNRYPFGNLKRSEEKMEDIFGPISDEESPLSGNESIQRESSTSRLFETPTHTQQPVVSAAINPYKQEPLTPKSHSVEENEGNKQKMSSHLEREKHRKEKREKKRKEREKSREQHALAALQQKMEDDNSVDLDEAGRALEAQLMEDSDNKMAEDMTPSTATTHKSDMTDVFRFSDGDENSLEVVSHEKKEPQELHKTKEKKKKKKRSKEERHQRREHHHHSSSSHNNSLMSPPPVSGKLSIEITPDTTEEPKEVLCKPSPSLPCLLDDDPPLKKSSSSSELNLSISPITREKTVISPIPKTPTISGNKTSECKKKPDKFIPGFDVELDEKISESAVKSISTEFTSPVLDTIPEEPKIPIESPPESKNLDKIEEKSRVIISQEETEDAVAALLGESFGNSSTADYSFTDDPIEVPPEEDIGVQVPVEQIIPEEDAEEMRKAVQSLSNEDIDIKADTPQSEHDLQIDTDTEEQEDETGTQLRFDNPPKTPDIDQAQIKRATSVPIKPEQPPPVVVGVTPPLPPEKKPEVEEIQNSPSVITKSSPKPVILKESPKVEVTKPSAPPLPPEPQEKPEPPKIEAAPRIPPPTPEIASNSHAPQVQQAITNSPSSRSQIVFSQQQRASPQTPLQTQPAAQIKLPVNRSQTQYVMQPPTINIPEQSHFVYPPINVMVSPRGGSNEHRMPSPRLQQPQPPQQNPQAQPQQSPQFVNVRVQSPHSPNIHRGPPAMIRHQSPMSPVMQQHVVLQQRQLMSPPGSVQPQPGGNSISTTNPTNIVLNRMPVTSVLAPISKPIQPTNIILPQPSSAQSSSVNKSDGPLAQQVESKDMKLSSQTITYQTTRVNTPTSASTGSLINNPAQPQPAAIQITSPKIPHPSSAGSIVVQQQAIQSPIKTVIETQSNTTQNQPPHIQHIIPVQVQQQKPQQHQTIILQQQGKQHIQQQPRLPQQIQQITKITPQQQQQLIQQHQLIQQRQQQMQIQQQQQQQQQKQIQQQQQQQGPQHVQMVHMQKMQQQKQQQHQQQPPPHLQNPQHRVVQQQVLQLQQYQQQQQQGGAKDGPHKNAGSPTSIIQTISSKDGAQSSSHGRIQQNVVIVRQQPSVVQQQQQMQKMGQPPAPQQMPQVQVHAIQQPISQVSHQQMKPSPIHQQQQPQYHPPQMRQQPPIPTQPQPQNQSQSVQANVGLQQKPPPPPQMHPQQQVQPPAQLPPQPQPHQQNSISPQPQQSLVHPQQHQSPPTQPIAAAQGIHQGFPLPPMQVQQQLDTAQGKVQIRVQLANQQTPVIKTQPEIVVQPPVPTTKPPQPPPPPSNPEKKTPEDLGTGKPARSPEEVEKPKEETVPKKEDHKDVEVTEKPDPKPKEQPLEVKKDFEKKSEEEINKPENKETLPPVEPETISVIKSQPPIVVTPPSNPKEKSLLTEENVTKLSPPEENELEQDSKEDSDYWSAKELNIDSVIKKVDALCSNDEVDESLAEKKLPLKEKQPIVENDTAAKKQEVPVIDQPGDANISKLESLPESAEADRSEDTHDEEEFDESQTEHSDYGGKTMRGGKRGRMNRGNKRAVPQVPPTSTGSLPNLNEGVQTRRGKIAQNMKTRRGRTAKATNSTPTPGEKKMRNQQSSDQDVYEFHEDSGEESGVVKTAERPRLILTIKSPGQASIVQTRTCEKSPQEHGKPLQEMNASPNPEPVGAAPVQKEGGAKEEFTTPAINTRKSRRLLEKDGGNRSTVDDVIEDVVRNSLNSPKSGGQTPPRRSTRNSQNTTANPRGPAPTLEKPAPNVIDVRKSPRANRRTKDRKSSDASVDSSDEKVCKPEEKLKPLQPDESEEETKTEKREEATIKKSTPGPEPITPEIVVKENAGEKIDKEIPGPTTDPSEPMTLIDPVTGVLTVVRQSKEGQYVPVPGAATPISTSKTDPRQSPQSVKVSAPELKPIPAEENKSKAATPTPPPPPPPSSTPSELPKISTPPVTNKAPSVVVTSQAVTVPPPSLPTTSSIAVQPPASIPHQTIALSQQSQQIQQQAQQQPQQQQQQPQQTQQQPQSAIRTHPLKAHMLSSQVNKPVVTQGLVKVGTSVLGQTAPVVVNSPNIIKPPAIVQTNIVARHLQQTGSNLAQPHSSQPHSAQPHSAQPHSAQPHSTQVPPPAVQQSSVAQAHHNPAVNIPTAPSQVGPAHSPRIQQNVVVKPQSQQQPPASSSQILHVVSKPGNQGQQILSQQNQHQPIVIHGNKIQQVQSPYTVLQSGKIIQQAPSPVTIQTVGKHQNIQVPMPPHVQPQQPHAHGQKQPSGISVVTHPGAKQGPTQPPQHQHHMSQQQQQQQQQQTQQHLQNSIPVKQQQGQSLQLGAGQQGGVVPGSQHIIAHAHQSTHVHQPTGATLMQAKPAHQQVIPPTKGVIGLHQAPQILTGAVASPPLKQPHIAGQQPVVTGASSLRASVPPISPQGQARTHMLQPGLPVPAFEANMGEGTYPTGAIRGVPPREHFIMYQYLRDFRAQEALGARIPYISRSPILPGSTDQKEISEVDEAMVASPPLELRRPGSGSRTIAVPHSLQSPQDRATDSPQVAQVYVHGTRIPHPHFPDVGARYFENVRTLPAEPPPAHRPAHSVVGPSPSNYSQSGGPPAATLPHMHPKAKEREREREQREREREQREREREKERLAIPGLLTAMPAAICRNILQLAPPPHANQVPPQADSLLTLLQRYPVMWQGLLALKTDQAAVQMHFVFGNPHVARGSLPCNSDGSTPPLRIAQRMRLEQTQLEGVAKKMQYENEHCMLLALPCGRDHLDVLQQSRNLQTGFITYLQQKAAAGIVNIPVPGSDQAAYVVHIFPSCEFANENLERAAPDLKHRVAEIAHLLIVIATV